MNPGELAGFDAHSFSIVHCSYVVKRKQCLHGGSPRSLVKALDDGLAIFKYIPNMKISPDIPVNSMEWVHVLGGVGMQER